MEFPVKTHRVKGESPKGQAESLKLIQSYLSWKEAPRCRTLIPQVRRLRSVTGMD